MEGGSGRSPGPGPALALRGTLMAVGGGSRLLAARRGERRSVSPGWGGVALRLGSLGRDFQSVETGRGGAALNRERGDLA